MILALLLALTQHSYSVDGAEIEDIPLPSYFEEENLKSTNDFGDPEAKSENAFVSIYTGDQAKSFGYLKMLLVLGHTIKTLSPNVDRILMIPSELDVDPQVITTIKKAWTHIVYRPLIQWPRGHNISIDSQLKMFRLQAWTLRSYKKIIIIGADTLILSDFTELFRAPVPTTVIDFYIFAMHKYGPTINTDFLMISPNVNDYLGLLQEAFKYLPMLRNGGKATWLGGDVGDFDQIVISSYFGGRFNILPFHYLHENGGNTDHIFGDPHKELSDIKVLGIHFGKAGKPWIDKKRSLYIEIWKIFASNAFEKMDIPFEVGNVVESGDDLLRVFWSANARRKRSAKYMEEAEDTDAEYVDVYPVLVKSGTRRSLTAFSLVLFASLLLLKSAIGSSNPFNVVMRKMESKIHEFVKLDEPSTEKKTEA